ncbi:AAEL017560-PA [Aedes aegypti]|uniref:AAEL017560-PA n=1 Tax=Aedes aegypti TaxID=7159 RepID=J9HI13_AEDAE|nr:AAEL017560-PA [Aedes aegypti]
MQKMHLSQDVSSALQQLEIIKQTVEEMDPNKLQLNVMDDLKMVLDLLQDPVFRNIVQIQDSLAELNNQITQHPSILPGDFDIASSGELVLNVPPVSDLFEADYPDEQRVPSAQISPGSPAPPHLQQQQKGGIMMEHPAQQPLPPLPVQLQHPPAMKMTNELMMDSGVGEEHLKLDSHDESALLQGMHDGSKLSGDLAAEWSRILDIELVNDGTGLGFGIIGARATGVTVKTILAGGVADRDGRLQSGDQILQIGDVNLHEMVSEQVASVLRQSGTHVQLVVARPIDATNGAIEEFENSAIVPTALLANPLKLKQYLADSGYPEIFSVYSIANLDKDSFDKDSPIDFPETEIFTVELKKDQNGLGITIAGYVCEKEELSGIFVKSVSPGSAADLSGKIQVNDRIIDFDGQSIPWVLTSTGKKMMDASIILPPPSNVEAELDLLLAETTNQAALIKHGKQRSSLKVNEDTEAFIVKKWNSILGSDVKIIVANIRKFAASSGLGISLEGTVDVEGGKEVRPHHYIRSILPEGPVGQNGLLRSGDELLEVNGQRLLGMNHLEVVSILKELPQDVCMVCGRGDQEMLQFTEEALINTLEEEAAKSRAGGLQSSLTPSERLVKAKSDGSLATTGGANDGFSKIKSRSLEPLTGLAMWSSEPQIIELVKGERGLGFSILDYQDPLDPNDTLIVIRSLVPGGVAQLDGRLIPGDRLLFVNDTVLENASLDQAVQALKGAPKGVVRIGVAKPLPMQDSSITAFEGDKGGDGGAMGYHGNDGSRNSVGKMLSMSKPDIIME